MLQTIEFEEVPNSLVGSCEDIDTLENIGSFFNERDIIDSYEKEVDEELQREITAML